MQLSRVNTFYSMLHGLQNELYQLVARDQLPAFLGGSCACVGGCVPQCDEILLEYCQVHIGANSKKLVELPVHGAGMHVLKWIS